MHIIEILVLQKKESFHPVSGRIGMLGYVIQQAEITKAPVRIFMN
jgi:hypothetical protein